MIKAVDRLGDFVVPSQPALETEAGQRNAHLYLQGLLSHLDRKNADCKRGQSEAGMDEYQVRTVRRESTI